MDEVEYDVKELFHFMNTHTDEFFIRVRFDEGGGLCGETDRCGSGEISEGWINGYGYIFAREFYSLISRRDGPFLSFYGGEFVARDQTILQKL